MTSRIYGRLPDPDRLLQVLPQIRGLPSTVYLAVAARWRNTQEVCWPSIKDIADDTEITTRSVYSALSKLQKVGLVDITPGPGRGNRNQYRPKNNEAGRTVSAPNSEDGFTVSKLNGEAGRAKRCNLVRKTVKSGALPYKEERDRKKQRDTSASKLKRKTPKKAGAGKTPKSRQPDLIWDTVAGIWFGGEVARPHQSRVGKVVRDLKLLDATPAEIQTRIDRYRRKWPRASATPEALVKHWTTFSQADADEDDGLSECRPCSPDDPRLDIAYPPTPEGRP